MINGRRCSRIAIPRLLLYLIVIIFVCLALVRFQPLRNQLETLMQLRTQKSVHRTLSDSTRQRNCLEDFADTEGNTVFITVKTTGQYHRRRLQLLLSTWIADAVSLKGRQQTPIFKVAVVSDAVDKVANIVLRGRMVESRCPSSHDKIDLCCKQATEFDLYFAEKDLAKWYCHFDDDNYVNIYNLLAELERHDAKSTLYLGKSSRGLAKLRNVLSPGRKAPSVAFTFGTGGAGFCLTKTAMQKIKSKISRAGGAGLEGLCRHLPGLADDVAVGYVAGYHNISLTQVPSLHSHLEKLALLTNQEILDAVSLSYTRFRSYENTVRLPLGNVTSSNDPTRFLSLHAYLKPKNCSP